MNGDPRRVLHCIPNMLNGGSQRQLVYLAAEQVRRGWDVNIALVHGGPVLESLLSTNATVHRLESRGNYDPRLFGRLFRLVLHIRPLVVQTWLTQMDVLGGLAANLARCPWVLTERASRLAYPPNLKNRLREMIGRRAQVIASVSEGGDRYWAHAPGRTPSRQIVPNAIPREDIARCLPISRAALGLEEDRKVVLYAGRLSPEKHIEVLLSALEDAGQRCALTAFLCGDGPLEHWTRTWIQGRDIAKQIRLVGYTTDVWSWMKAADVFVSLGTTEGNPNAVLEAIASGCTLVLSDTPEHREIVADGGALFVPFDSASRAADAIVECLENPADARCRAANAREGVKPWSIGDVADRYERIYNIAVEKKGRA